MVELITITNIRNEFHFHSMQHNESQVFLNNKRNEYVLVQNTGLTEVVPQY